MAIYEKPAKAEASKEEAEHLAKLLQDRFPPPEADRSKPQGYHYATLNHREDEDELIKMGKFAPTIMGLSDMMEKALRTASGEEVALIIRRGVALDPDTQEPSGETLIRYKALYLDSEAKDVANNTIDPGGVIELAHIEDEKGFIVDIYDSGQVDVWHGLMATHIPSRELPRWVHSHRRATGQEVFTYYNDVDLARELPEPQA